MTTTAILNIALTCTHLPVRAALDPIRRIYVDSLDPALQPLFFGERGHDLEVVAQDHAIGPVLLMLVELDHLLERQSVEVGEESSFLSMFLLGFVPELLNHVFRRNALLLVDRQYGNG